MRNNSVRIISVMLSDTQSNNLSLSAVKQALLLDMTHYIVTITAAVLLLLVGKNPPFDRYWSPERRVRKIKVWSSKYNQNLFSFPYLWLRTGEISFRLKKLSNFLDLFFPSVRQMENKSLIRWGRKKKVSPRSFFSPVRKWMKEGGTFILLNNGNNVDQTWLRRLSLRASVVFSHLLDFLISNHNWTKRMI